MRHRPEVLPAALEWGPAAAEEPRVHVIVGAAHAVGLPDGCELGPAGRGAATVDAEPIVIQGALR